MTQLVYAIFNVIIYNEYSKGLNKIVLRNCQFHAKFYCYSFLCIQYQILSSEKIKVISSVLIGTLYLAPGTQHCLQEKSTSFLLLTEHLKLCHREYPHRYHSLIDN